MATIKLGWHLCRQTIFVVLGSSGGLMMRWSLARQAFERTFSLVACSIIRVGRSMTYGFVCVASVDVSVEGVYSVDVMIVSIVRHPYISSFNTLFHHSFSLIILCSQSKNTCAHNNTQKAHANGIKKKKRTKYVSTRGMDPKFLRNQKFCKKYNGSKRPVRDDDGDE
jgi:large subunit ribosomal protein L29e